MPHVLMPSADAILDETIAVVEEKELVRFERADEYLSLLSRIVPTAGGSGAAATEATTPLSAQLLPATTPDEALSTLVAILDEYQDQSNLLDPYLERIVSPPIEALQRHVRLLGQGEHNGASDRLSADSVNQLSKLVYAYTKVRGYKTIIHYFPHEVADLPATLSFLEELQRSLQSQGAESSSEPWELRYICLLWLSLICMIPFDLAKFDRSSSEDRNTASRITAVAEHFITSPGKERDAASVVLGRLFERTDVQLTGYFNSFLQTSRKALETNDLSPFHATGILQALCEILKTSEPAFVATHLTALQTIIDIYEAQQSQALTGNGLIVKYHTKLISRLALKLLRPRARRYANKFHILGVSSGNTSTSHPDQIEEDDDESDVPEEIETFISYLIEALQHKDTVVRYSAAKGLARLCDRLPNSFLDQVVEAVISLFHINVPDLYSGAEDLSSVSEHTWQGACMALAELSRRGLLFAAMLSEALPWILKALLFDVRRGAHSVGANVRDAACYVVWALARSNDVDSIRPHAMALAKRLVAVATLDRDVSIRRAASAAFQESVGRLSLFPHGIAVTRMTDFYAVSVRRSAFLECAVNVASFDEYRGYLLNHLINVVTVHWDPAIRRLGARSAALIAMHDAKMLLPEITQRLSDRVGTSDVAVLHGTLLTLAELCRVSRTLLGEEAMIGAEIRATAFGLLDAVRPSVFRSLGSSSILQAACQLIGAGFSPSTTSSDLETQTWEKVLNVALARQEELVHVSAAEAVSQLSSVVDLSAKIRSTIETWSSLTLAQQQSNSLLLGAVDFKTHAGCFEPVTNHLIALGQPRTKTPSNKLYSDNIEVRRNAVDSITRATLGLNHRFAEICTSVLLRKMVNSMLVGLEDYSTDQRGDVGSWVRLSCVAGLRQILIFQSHQVSEIRSWLSSVEFQLAIGAMWKQAAERIDHVRHTAGGSILAVYHAYDGLDTSVKPLGYEVVKSTYGSKCLRPFGNPSTSLKAGDDDDSAIGQSFKDPKLAFPCLCRLLLIPTYRASVLEGLIVSVGSQSDLGERIIGPALTALITTTSQQEYDLVQLLTDLFELAKQKFRDNRIFVPAIQAVNLLLENGASHPSMNEVLVRWVKMATTNAGKIKSIPRLIASATLSANLVLAIVNVDNDQTGKQQEKRTLIECLIKSTETFLTHPSFPKVRVQMAEHLYAVLSSSISFEETDDEKQDEAKLETWEQLETDLLDTKWGGSTRVEGETIKPVTEALSRLLT